MSDREFLKMLRAEEKEKVQSRGRKSKDGSVKRMSDGFRLVGKRGEWQGAGDDIQSGEEVVILRQQQISSI